MYPFDDVESHCISNIFNSSHGEEISFVDSSKAKFEDDFFGRYFKLTVSQCSLICYI